MTKIPTTNLPDGTSIPVFGMGTWKFTQGSADHATELATLRQGFDLGVTLVDTAERYAAGGAEELVGDAIAGRRDQIYLVSKIMPSNASGEKAAEACEASLKRMKTDRIDLYLLHWREETPLEETVEAFERLKKDGKILRWGVSNFSIDDMIDLDALSKDCMVNQVLYNLSRRGIEYDLLAWSSSRSMPIMAYSPIEHGLLAQDPVVARIASAHDATPAQVALAWVMRRPEFLAIPKTSSPKRVVENLKSLELKLTDAELKELDLAFPPPQAARPLETV